MGILDQIRKVDIVPTPETVNADWESEPASLDDREGAFSIYFKYENGTSVDMTAYLQLSPNGVDWADVEETDQPFTDPNGIVAYDVNGSGMQWVRIRIAVTAGSIDVTEGLFTGSQRH